MLYGEVGNTTKASYILAGGARRMTIDLTYKRQGAHHNPKDHTEDQACYLRCSPSPNGKEISVVYNEQCMYGEIPILTRATPLREILVRSK